ncbi:MAG: 2-hydroxyacid dehydrogenase [Patescibacteria group bacterium]
MKIIIINSSKDFTPEQVKRLEDAGEVSFIETSEEYKIILDLIKNTDEKIIALGPDVVEWKFPNETIDKIEGLKAVCLPTTGFAWVDGAHLRQTGIDLTNVPKYSTESVAEYAISLMLNVTKKLPLVIKSGWKIDYGKHQGWEIKGKTMGIVGLGAIGSRIAELGKQMGMNVVYWSRNSRNDEYAYKELDELLKTSDYVFPTLAKNLDTHHMINKDKLGLMKRGAFIVSITGDDIFDFEHAVEKVKKDKLGGVALELADKSINDFEGNIWVTPAIAWFTKEAFAEDMRIWVETIYSCAKGKPINIVN